MQYTYEKELGRVKEDAMTADSDRKSEIDPRANDGIARMQG
jgi:hypothetical protein